MQNFSQQLLEAYDKECPFCNMTIVTIRSWIIRRKNAMPQSNLSLLRGYKITLK